MGPKPTAVDQAGRPPRKLWASSLSFQLSAYAEAMNPASLTITIRLSVVSLSVVLMIPESFSKDNLASSTSGFDCKTRINLLVQPLQVIPLIVSVWTASAMAFPRYDD